MVVVVALAPRSHVQERCCSLCRVISCLPWPRVVGQCQVLIIIACALRWHLVSSVARVAGSSSWVTCVARDVWCMGSGRKVAVHKVSVAWRLAFTSIVTLYLWQPYWLILCTIILAWFITPAWLRPRADLRILLAMPVMTAVMMVNWMLLLLAA